MQFCRFFFANVKKSSCAIVLVTILPTNFGLICADEVLNCHKKAPPGAAGRLAV